MTVLAAALVAAAVLVVRPARRSARNRVAAVGAPGPPPVSVDPSSAAPPTLRRTVVLAGLTGVALLLLTGVSRWTLALLAVGLVATARSRRPPAPATELPLVLDLLAAGLRGGALLPAALEVAAGAAATDLGERLGSVGRALRAGSYPAEAWSECAVDADLVQVSRICTRVGASGASSAAELERLSRRLRARRRHDLDARSARASVWVVLPLCLCFLPAFVLVGVVPMAVSLLETVK